MILKRKTPEERFAEDLARELERQAKEMEKSLTPEARERLKLMDKNSEAWRLAEERIGRGEIKLYWRKIGDDLYIVARETFKNFPFKRHGEYILLPSGLDGYMHVHPPMSVDWVHANGEKWRPRSLASMKWLEEPVNATSYDGYYDAAYRCVIEARDGRLFLARALECLLLERCNGKFAAEDIATSAAEEYFQRLWHYSLKKEVREGLTSKDEAKKIMDELPQRAFIGLAILKDLGLII